MHRRGTKEAKNLHQRKPLAEKTSILFILYPHRTGCNKGGLERSIIFISLGPLRLCGA